MEGYTGRGCSEKGPSFAEILMERELCCKDPGQLHADYGCVDR